jgi:hypothetical protein
MSKRAEEKDHRRVIRKIHNRQHDKSVKDMLKQMERYNNNWMAEETENRLLKVNRRRPVYRTGAASMTFVDEEIGIR